MYPIVCKSLSPRPLTHLHRIAHYSTVSVCSHSHTCHINVAIDIRSTHTSAKHYVLTHIVITVDHSLAFYKYPQARRIQLQTKEYKEPQHTRQSIQISSRVPKQYLHSTSTMNLEGSRVTSEAFSTPVQPSQTPPPRPTGPKPQAQLIDFSASPLKTIYPCHYALVIDNCFTPEECDKLIALAEETATWKPASVDGGGVEGVVVSSYRNSERIIRDDHETAAWIFARVRPWLDDVNIIGQWTKWKHIVPVPWRPSENPTWQMTRVNERLRFLKYGPGQDFKRHCDGQFSTTYVNPDEPEERSFLTIQIYLRSSPDLDGGATTIYGRTPATKDSLEIDVDAVPGRVLIFQQRDIIHSGQLVKKGEKIAVRTELLYKKITRAEAEGET